MRAYAVSSYSLFGKPIENVLTGPEQNSDIKATTADESTPPERNAPRGTSEISRSLMASFNRSTSSAASAFLLALLLAARGGGSRQYSAGFVIRQPWPTYSATM